MNSDGNKSEAARCLSENGVHFVYCSPALSLPIIIEKMLLSKVVFINTPLNLRLEQAEISKVLDLNMDIN